MSTSPVSDGGTVHDGGLFGNADRRIRRDRIRPSSYMPGMFGGLAADQRGTGLYTAVGHTGLTTCCEQCRDRCLPQAM